MPSNYFNEENKTPYIISNFSEFSTYILLSIVNSFQIYLFGWKEGKIDEDGITEHYWAFFDGDPHKSKGNSDPKGFVSSFKTVDFVADQSSASNLTYASKFRKSKIYKGKSAADFLGRPPKINRGT